MAEPYEILAAPFDIYVAPVGEVFPVVNASPAGNWVLLGASGSRSMNESGVIVTHSQTVNLQRVLGTTGPRKAFRTQEDVMVEFTLLDITAEMYARAINGQTVTTDAGPPAIKHIPFRQGLVVVQYAVLARAAASPYGDNLNMQYEFPRAVQIENPAPAFTKGEGAGLIFRFTALEDPSTGNLGRLVDQTS